jgi:CHAD domain-containing protein
MSATKADGKWVEGLTPDMAVGKAARLALEMRLEATHETLAAARELSSDAEPIHEMRVASRRAAAALQVFSERLPGKSARHARKSLRRLRRGVAAAREADVFFAALECWAPDRAKVEKPGLQYLFGHVTAQRRAAQDEVCAAIDRCKSEWAFRVERCPKKVRRGGGPLRQFAPPICAALVMDLDCSIAAGDFENAEKLHAMRIAGKRFRYAFELLAPALAPAAHETLYPTLVELQSLLGAAHDSWQTIRRLDGLIDDVAAMRPQLMRSVRAGLSAFRSAQREQIAAHKAAFTTWRSKWPAVRTIDFRL